MGAGHTQVDDYGRAGVLIGKGGAARLVAVDDVVARPADDEVVARSPEHRFAVVAQERPVVPRAEIDAAGLDTVDAVIEYVAILEVNGAVDCAGIDNLTSLSAALGELLRATNAEIDLAIDRAAVGQVNELRRPEAVAGNVG